MTEAYETPRKAVDYKFYILQVSASTFEGPSEEGESDTPKAYLRAGYMAEIDKNLATRGAYSPLCGSYNCRLVTCYSSRIVRKSILSSILHFPDLEEEPNHLTRKRKVTHSLRPHLFDNVVYRFLEGNIRPGGRDIKKIKKKN